MVAAAIASPTKHKGLKRINQFPTATRGSAYAHPVTRMLYAKVPDPKHFHRLPHFTHPDIATVAPRELVSDGPSAAFACCCVDLVKFRLILPPPRLHLHHPNTSHSNNNHVLPQL
jgi:hypothetical protein